MAIKQAGNLVHTDLGKNVVVKEANEDRNSGILKSVSHTSLGVQVRVDNATLTVKPDTVVEFSD
ncbi:hypothetical protein [Pseudoclavibacter sp. CFCC 11306]|uniref:hypothetical protein n=1 Tax=Pseudoclavibacter sp. CFCC 11306 TaxID=1564493 RepID=UPI001300D709|nr:hypothetical protein [Pseudoclavibacter sp. CFCC 11306]KAB1659016.1 hypothetical protein F8O09_05475 [Pseudoclavibacter sp. CFCC 11306]